MENDSPKTIDWLAIRAAYETSGEPMRIIAELHGVTKRMIDRRLVNEAWLKRRDASARPGGMKSSRRKGLAPDQYVGACPDRQTASHFGGTCSGRIATRPGATPKTFQVDWPAVRHDYETGEYSVAEVARRHGCSRSRLQQQKDLEQWQERRPAYPKAYGAGGKVTARQRLKAGLAQKLATLAARLGLAEKLDVSDLQKTVQTLADAIEKLLDAREKSGDDSDRLHINDATRDALAERLEALARSWERRRDSAGAGCKRAGAD